MKKHQEPYSCERCDQKFVNKWDLKKHVKLTHGPQDPDFHTLLATDQSNLDTICAEVYEATQT
jgi:hypothetical protein